MLTINSVLLLQSQFRFDNECYLNLPENHKRVSLTHSAYKTVDERRTSQDDARIQQFNINESNFNLDDFNIASVSMPDFYFNYLIYFNIIFYIILYRIQNFNNYFLFFILCSIHLIYYFFVV